MTAAALLEALLAAAQFGPGLPPVEIAFLAGPSLAGLHAVPPARATTIRFSGGFTFGGAKALQDALDQAPSARQVLLNSPGGRIGPADAVANLVHDRHLSTAVDSYCASACTMVFAAGRDRAAAKGASFGFHLGSGPIFTDLLAAVAVQFERPWYVKAGVSLAFANRALHAPNLQPYFPRLDELVAAGFVQRVEPVPAGKPATTPPDLRELLAAVARLEPATAAIIGQAATGPDTARAELDAALVANRWLARSTDRAALAFVAATLAVLDTLGTTDPAACMRWQVGVTDQAEGLRAIPPAQRAALRAAQAALLRDASPGRPVPASTPALSAAEQAVRDAVKQRFGPRALLDAATPEHAFADPGRSCAALAAFLRGLQERPEGGALVRWALAAG